MSTVVIDRAWIVNEVRAAVRQFFRPLTWAIGLALLLAACASHPSPEITGRTAEIVVRASCVPASVPDAPTAWADDALPLDPASAAIRYRNIAAAREAARAWILLAAPAIAACR